MVQQDLFRDPPLDRLEGDHIPGVFSLSNLEQLSRFNEMDREKTLEQSQNKASQKIAARVLPHSTTITIRLQS